MKQNMKVITLNKATQASCVSSTVRICTATGFISMIKVLVMQKKPLNYNLFLGLMPLRLWVAFVSCVLEAFSLRRDSLSVCAVLCIYEADFSVKFDVRWRVWVTAWKCLVGCVLEKLKNRISKYLVFDQLRVECEYELTVMDGQRLVATL